VSWLTWRRGLLVGLGAVVVAVGLLVAGDYLWWRGEVHGGVVLWGSPVGGMDADALAGRLREESETKLQRPVRLTAQGVTTELVPAAAGVSVDVGRTVAAALAVGRAGSFWHGLQDRASLWVRPEYVEPVLAVDDAAWQVVTDDVALAIERLPRDARLTLTADHPEVVPSQDGLALDREALRAALVSAVAEDATEISLPLRTLAPRITSELAQQAVIPAQVVLATPVTLGFRDKSFRLSPADLVKMAALDQAGLAVGRPFTFETEAARGLLESLLGGIETPAVDAVIKPGADGKSYTVVPSKNGAVVEWDSLIAAITRVSLEPDHRYVPIPTAVAAPKLTTTDAELLYDRRVVASFETYFSPSNEARAHNIQQVASLLDGRVVRPGEVFSFNKAVGPTTKAAGFDEAPVIVDGALTPGVGGGICQVSTTLFNAVFFAGLPVVERRPHSFYIEHYPVGRDATVSQGEVDFKFRNDTNQVLLISASATDRSVKVSVAAAVWDRVVAYQLLPPHDFVAPGSTAAKPRRLGDPSLSAGEVSEVEPGIEGRTVRIERTVKRLDGSTLFSDAFDSVYAPKDYIVRVGPAA
jgi:vancomycin resistance protein YoaR